MNSAPENASFPVMRVLSCLAYHFQHTSNEKRLLNAPCPASPAPTFRRRASKPDDLFLHPDVEGEQGLLGSSAVGKLGEAPGVRSLAGSEAAMEESCVMLMQALSSQSKVDGVARTLSVVLCIVRIVSSDASLASCSLTGCASFSSVSSRLVSLSCEEYTASACLLSAVWHSSIIC